MKVAVTLVALMLVAVPLAGRAFAKKHDEFEVKELRELRAEHQEDKILQQEERSEEHEKTQARAHPKPHPQQRHGVTSDDAGDSDAD
jgi:hypothetical protein